MDPWHSPSTTSPPSPLGLSTQATDSLAPSWPPSQSPQASWAASPSPSPCPDLARPSDSPLWLPSHQLPDSLALPDLPKQSPQASSFPTPEVTPASYSSPGTLDNAFQDASEHGWGQFGQPDLPIPKIDSPVIPVSTSDGWDGTASLGDWEPPPLALASPPATSTHAIVSQHSSTPSAWESPQLEYPCSSEHHPDDRTEMGDVVDVWAESKPSVTYKVPIETVTEFQGKTREWATEEYPVQEENFLPPGKAAMTMDLNSAMNEGGELSVDADIVANFSKPPLPETSEISTQNLFQNSAISNAFHAAINQTASSAASVLKSASRPRKLFPIAGVSGPSKPQASSSEIAQSLSAPSGSDSSWNAFSALQASHHSHNNKKDASGSDDAEQVAQQPSQRSSIFGLWTAKPPANSLNNVPNPATGGNPPSIPSRPSSTSVPSATDSCHPDSQASASCSLDAPRGPAPSRLSRLFGRFALRSKDSPTSESSSSTSPASELNERDVAFLDSVKTVPLEKNLELHETFDILKLSGQTERRFTNNESKTPFQAGHSARSSGNCPPQDMLDFLAFGTSAHKPTTDPSIIPEKVLHQKSQASSLSQATAEPDPFDVFNASPIQTVAQTSKQPSIRPVNMANQGPSPLYDQHTSSSLLSRPSSQPISHPKSASNQIPNNSRHDDLDNLFSVFETEPPPPLTAPRTMASAMRDTKFLHGDSLRPNTRTPIPTVHLSKSNHLANAAAAAQVPILGPPPRSPVPLIAPPLTRGASASTGSATLLAPRPPPSSSSSSSTMISSPVVLSPVPNRLDHPPDGGGLSKQDLSFFDSLL